MKTMVMVLSIFFKKYILKNNELFNIVHQYRLSHNHNLGYLRCKKNCDKCIPNSILKTLLQLCK